MIEDKSGFRKDLFPIALLIFMGIYLCLTVFVGWLLIDWRHMSGIIYFIGFELLFIGISYDVTESLFALFVKPLYIPNLSQLNTYPHVALLMTVCNDARPDRWETLIQDYPNYQVYILDDSNNLGQRELVDQSGYHVVRRMDRQGYKAGNLNNWLRHFGNKYKYFVILDSDSLIRRDFVQNLVKYAEHPCNESVAIFQSYIMPTDANTQFTRTLGSMAQMRRYILERFANRTGLVLSWGHNQMVRTDAILRLGGYDERISPEDTTISLMLSTAGYSCQLVNVESYDTDPPDIFSFSRRVRRWAGQTAELFSLPWIGAVFRLKALLCFHLYSYTVHVFYLVLLIMTAWAYDSRDISLMELWTFAGAHPEQTSLWVVVLAGMTILWVGQLGLRLLIGMRAGMRVKDFFKHMLLATALYSFTGMTVIISVGRVFAGHKMDFSPTNASSVKHQIERKMLIGEVLFWLGIGILIVTGMGFRNQLLFFSLNGL